MVRRKTEKFEAQAA